MKGVANSQMNTGGGNLSYHRQSRTGNQRVQHTSSNKANLYDPQFLQYCQSCVNQKVHVQEQNSYLEMPDNRNDSWCGTVGRCILAIPACSLTCWVLLALGMAACSGAFYVAAYRTRDWLEKPNTFLGHAETISMAVLGGMMFFGTLALMVATLVSNPTNKSVFNTSNKNTCGKMLNVIVITVLFILDIVWVACTVILAVPLMYFLLLHVLYKDIGVDRIDLKNYALSRETKVIEGSQLDSFYSMGRDVFICYVISLSGAFLVVISLTGFLLCASANAVYMKEARFSAMNAYRNNVNISKTSVIDTRM